MPRSLYVRIFLIFFLVGVGLGALADWKVIACVFLLTCGFCLFLGSRLRNFLSILIVGIMATLFGISRFLVAVPHFSSEDIAFYRDMAFEVEVFGEIVDEPYLKKGFLYALIEAQELVVQQKKLLVHGQVQLKLQRYPSYHYGDFLKIKGLLEKPFFENGNVYVFAPRPKVISASFGHKKDLLQLVFAFKNFLLARLEQLFPEPDSSLAAGILLGERSSIPFNLLNDFNRVGLTHILAISGYNITLIIQLLALSLKPVPRTLRFTITIFFLLLFVLLTGFSASVVRAAFMGGLSLSATMLYRRSQGLQVLLVSGFIMVLIDPFLLPFDISFQLSFLATLGLFLFMPLFEKLEGVWLKIPSAIKEGLLVTVAAQLLTIPVTLLHFGRLSLVSFLSNVALLPIMPLLMLFSFAALLCSLIFLWPLAMVAVALYWICARFLLGGVAFFSAFPFAAVDITFFPWWLALIYYFLLGSFLFRDQIKLLISHTPK